MPIHRSKDVQGPYYAFGKTGERYYYEAGDSISREIARGKAARQGRAIEASKHGHLKGAGFRDWIPSFIEKRLPFIRTQAPPAVREQIAKKGNMPIVQVQVCRIPVNAAITGLTNAISSGQVNKAKSELGYDKLYHLFMVFTFSDNSRIRMDKNQVVHVQVGGGPEGQVKSAGNPKVDLGTFLSRGEQAAGSQRNYWVYTPHEFNCQRWCLDGLSGNGLLTPELRSFIEQDAQKLLPPGTGRTIANFLTDIAARADRVIHGEGRKRPKKRMVRRVAVIHRKKAIHKAPKYYY